MRQNRLYFCKTTNDFFFLLIKEILKINFELFIKIKKQQTNTLFVCCFKEAANTAYISYAF